MLKTEDLLFAMDTYYCPVGLLSQHKFCFDNMWAAYVNIVSPLRPVSFNLSLIGSGVSSDGQLDQTVNIQNSHVNFLRRLPIQAFCILVAAPLHLGLGIGN